MRLKGFRKKRRMQLYYQSTLASQRNFYVRTLADVHARESFAQGQSSYVTTPQQYGCDR